MHDRVTDNSLKAFSKRTFSCELVLMGKIIPYYFFGLFVLFFVVYFLFVQLKRGGTKPLKTVLQTCFIITISSNLHFVSVFSADANHDSKME